MVEKSVKLSSKSSNSVEIMNQLLASKSLARKSKAATDLSDDDDLSDDLSDISDTEVGGYLNNKKESLLNKIAWEMMNPEYRKPSKPATGKRKDLTNKIAPSKKNSAVRTGSNAESVNKKRPDLEVSFDVLDELFDTENAPKRTKLEKQIVVCEQTEYSERNSEEGVLKPQGAEEEEELDWNEDYSNEDAYEGAEEFCGDPDLEFEDQDGDYDNEGVIF